MSVPRHHGEASLTLQQIEFILDALQPALDAAVHEVAAPMADAILDLLIAIGNDATKYPGEVIAAQRAVLIWERGK